MDHVAILRKARISKGDNLLGDILSGKKTIESRWYVNKIAPWNNIEAGEYVYLKESGCPVTAKAKVTKVIQYENLDINLIKKITSEYGSQIDPNDSPEDLEKWVIAQGNKRYCILIFLSEVEKITPFEVDKTGYGISSAWLVTDNINKLKVK